MDEDGVVLTSYWHERQQVRGKPPGEALVDLYSATSRGYGEPHRQQLLSPTSTGTRNQRLSVGEVPWKGRRGSP